MIVALAGCPSSDDGPPAEDTGGQASDSTTDGGTFVSGEDTMADGVEEDSGGADSSGEDAVDDDGANMGECSLFEQDCPDGEKCAPWSDSNDLVPDDIRCCPNVAPGTGLHGEPCTVQEYFGSCLDDCAAGHMCLDINNDGEGFCQKFCGGTAASPECALDETCFIYFSGVPFCFRLCDPLVQDCNDGEGCYPDEAEAGGTGFICIPTIGSGKIYDPCWLLSNCEPGLLCVSPDFLPDCSNIIPNAGCCTAICDSSAADQCDDIVPGTACVNWYYQGQMPPSVDLEDVGACVLPP